MLSDDQLLAKLETLSRLGRRLDVRIILLLIQVEERRLDRRAACPSLYGFCRQKLGMPARSPSGLAAPVGGEPKPPEPAPGPLSPGAPRDARGRLAPLAEARWRLQLTADKALHERIERARALMRHRNPSGDLTVVIAAAVDALLEKLEAPRKEKRTTTPRARRRMKPGAIAIATRRAVFARDGEQCTYRDEHGGRCPAATRLELDHIESRARGGSGEPDNLRVRCDAHNLLHAEEDFGRSHIEAKIHARRQHRAAAAEVAAAARPRGPQEPRAGP